MILDHEHQWVRLDRRLEECTLDGCMAGRYSREWLDSMKSKPLPERSPPQHGEGR